MWRHVAAIFGAFVIYATLVRYIPLTHRIHWLKIRNHLVTGVNRISDATCGACSATPTIFQNRAIQAIAIFALVLRYPGGTVSTMP